jgi:dihydroorotate dehydrogenase
MSSNLRQWYPDHPPLYDIHKTYLENAADGPRFNAPIPNRQMPPREQWINFLGHSVASRVGIPAGPLLTSQWIALAAQLGFDIPVYKTIRSKEHPSHPLPNMIFVDTESPITPAHCPKNARLSTTPAAEISSLAVTNSFGMPSKSPSFLMEDIARANAALSDGQVMVVSVVGTQRSDLSFLDDFVAAASLAKEAGAKIIEANFSCPNVGKSEGSLYTSPTAVRDIGQALAKAIAPLPLIIKVGTFASSSLMKAVLIAAAKAGVRAISGINTVSLPVVDARGNPALGKERMTSGICGGAIRSVALDFVANAARINRDELLGLTLIGVGGITLPEHFDLFFEQGPDIAMSATGMMWDPYLAARYHNNENL